MAYPLAAVIMVSMVKDAFEDYKRHQSDAQENEKKVLTFDRASASFQLKQWQRIIVGDILKINSDEYIPADLLILSSSDPKGCCYIETKNLDGETNLKIKTVQKDLNQNFKTIEDLQSIAGEIICEKPNGAIHNFEGNIKIRQLESKIGLSADNLLLRSCSLRNTDYVYGVAVFTGHDTKVMKNSAKAKYKFSTLEKLTN